MRVKRWLIQAYHHPWWIPALSIVAVIALIGTMVLFVLYAADQRNERQNRHATDVTLCNRANTLRGQVIRIGDANEEMLQGVIDVVLPADSANGERAARIREIREALEPVFAKHSAAVDEIRFLDCAAIPGG